MAILRFPDTIERTPGSGALKPEPPAWNKDEEVIYETLDKGTPVSFKTKAFPVIREKALGYLGRPFDYDMEFGSPERICCTELVYWCTKSLYPFLRIEPREERLFVFRKTVILPDTYFDSNLQRVWCSASCRDDTQRSSS
jgi:hypothetical protein